MRPEKMMQRSEARQIILLELDARGPDRFGPFFGVFGDELAVVDIGTPPRSTRRALNLGSARAALTSLFSLSIISAGVFLGAPRPAQMLAPYPGTDSPTVGISGSSDERVEVALRRRHDAALDFSNISVHRGRESEKDVVLQQFF
jgi:hypothetical protein